MARAAVAGRLVTRSRGRGKAYALVGSVPAGDGSVQSFCFQCRTALIPVDPRYPRNVEPRPGDEWILVDGVFERRGRHQWRNAKERDKALATNELFPGEGGYALRLLYLRVRCPQCGQVQAIDRTPHVDG